MAWIHVAFCELGRSGSLAKQLGIWWYLWVLVSEQVEAAPDAQPPSGLEGGTLR